MTSITAINDHQLTIPEPLPLNQSPAAVYLAGLASANSQHNMGRYLHQIDAFPIQ